MRRAIEADGFAIREDVLTPQEVAQVLGRLTRSSLPRSRAGVRHALRHRAVREMAQDPRLLQIAREVLGPTAQPFRATLFDKSPAANWLVAWHQDTALPLRQRREVPGWGPWSVKGGIVYAHAPVAALERILALRLHLDDSTARNGPLRVLPGTHRRGVLPEELAHQLAAEILPVDCLVPRGGVLAMRPLLIHASSKSQAEVPRRVLHVEYASSMDMGDGLELAVA